MKTEAANNNLSKNHNKRKSIIAAICFVLFVIVALAVSSFEQELKSDPASERVIREIAARQLDKEPNDLRKWDFAEIKRFEFLTINTERYLSFLADIIRDVEIKDIKFIENFKCLEYLNLTGTTYSENAIPKWVRILAKLGIYDLDKKYSIDISILKNLPNLKTLLIDGKNVKDIKYITNIPNLEQLYIGNIECIKSTKDLSKLKNLKYLDLWVSGPCSLEPLRKLKNLERLTLCGTGISDIEPLSDLNNLGELRLDDTLVSNLEPLKGLKKLRRLSIAGCKYITDEQVQDLQKVLPETKISIRDH